MTCFEIFIVLGTKAECEGSFLKPRNIKLNTRHALDAKRTRPRMSVAKRFHNENPFQRDR